MQQVSIYILAQFHKCQEEDNEALRAGMDLYLY